MIVAFRFWLSPWTALLAASCIASRVAGDRPVRAGQWHNLRRLSLTGAGAVIVGLPDGYAVHEVRARGVGPIVARIYAIDPTPPKLDGTRATWRARQTWAQQRARQLRLVHGGLVV